MESDRKGSFEEKFNQHWDESHDTEIERGVSEKIYQAISNELDFSKNRRSKTSFKKRFQWLKYAAVLVILVSISTYYFVANSEPTNSESQVNEMRMVASNEESRLLVLEDDSSVELHANSELTFPTTFGDSLREVFLTGSASFSVVADKERPFIVNQDELITEVLGTTFTINDDSASSIVKIDLYSGEIAIYDRKETFRKLLLPGDSFLFDKIKKREMIKDNQESVKPLIVKVGDIISNKISITFVNVKIRDAYQKIEEQTGLKIDCAGLGTEGDIFLSLEYEDETVEKILKDLNSFGNYSYYLQDNTVVISR